jgi:hypothetical protein
MLSRNLGVPKALCSVFTDAWRLISKSAANPLRHLLMPTTHMRIDNMAGINPISFKMIALLYAHL